MVFACVITHPLVLICSFAVSHLTKKLLVPKSGKFKFELTLFFGAIIIVPLFVHSGTKILTYLPWGNPLTLESIIYAVSVYILLSSVLAWSSVISKELTSDKITYAIGEKFPIMAMMISLIMRLIPSLIAKFRQVYAIKKINFSDDKSVKKQISMIAQVFIATLTWALDNSSDTVLSIKARTFKNKKRTSLGIFEMTLKDKWIGALRVLSGVVMAYFWLTGIYSWNYFVLNNFKRIFESLWCIIPAILFYGASLFCIKRRDNI